MTKKGEISWSQLGSNEARIVTYIGKTNLSSLACYLVFLGHFVLNMCRDSKMPIPGQDRTKRHFPQNDVSKNQIRAKALFPKIGTKVSQESPDTSPQCKQSYTSL